MDPTNRNTALASAMVEELARCGVRDAVLAPGSRSTPLALALWREPAISTRVIVDERSAGFFALGAAQATGVPVAVLCTSGTAAANLHPAVCEADEAAVPLIVLTADRPPELRGIGAGQTIDQLGLYGSAPRWFCEVGTHEADDAGLLHHRSVACRAFAAAAGDPRPGPVHLNVSWRDPLGPEPRPDDLTATSPPALEGRGDRPLTKVGGGAAAPPETIGELASRMGSHRRGVIVAGRQPDPALAEPLAALARVSGYPILAEPTSQLRLGPHDRGMVITQYGAIAAQAPAALTPSSSSASATCRPASRSASGSLRWTRSSGWSTDATAGTSRPASPPPSSARPSPGSPPTWRRGSRRGPTAPGRPPGGPPRPPPSPPSRPSWHSSTSPPSRAPTPPSGASMPTATSSTPPQHADPRPGGVRSPGPRVGALSLQPRRERHRGSVVRDRRRVLYPLPSG